MSDDEAEPSQRYLNEDMVGASSVAGKCWLTVFRRCSPGDAALRLRKVTHLSIELRAQRQLVSSRYMHPTAVDCVVCVYAVEDVIRRVV